MVDENPWMFHQPVLGNVMYGLSVRGVARREARGRAMSALELVGMTHAARWSGPNLSAGETRRVALARALVLDPELLLLDEPLGGIDAQHAAAIEGVVRELPRDGATVLLATHRLDSAFRLTDRCVSIVDGHIREVVPGNHFTGTVVEENGEPVMHLSPDCTLRLATAVRGSAHVTIDPRTVIVSRTPPRSSARNCFTGKITGLTEEAERVRLRVDVGVPITALITRRSLHEMDIRLGEKVVVLFKAVSASVYQGKPR